MTFVPGNQGIQPLYSPSASSPRHQVRPRKANQPVPPEAQSVRFAGSPVRNALNNAGQRFVTRALPTFENITEVFIWGFLAQDVFAMWLPRIYALLTEGRKKYDPKDDANAKNKPFGTQFRKYIKGNLEGLNWDNFYEGTKREFSTGPGLLIVPALIYCAATKAVNSAIKMPYAAVKGMSKGMKRHFGEGNLTKQSEYIDQVADYVNSIFQDPKLAGKDATIGKEPLKKLIVDLKNEGKDTSHIIKDMSKWSKQWVENFYEKDAGKKKETAEALSTQLKETIRAFNRQYRMEAYHKAAGQGNEVNRLIHDEHPLHRTESTWISYQPEKMADRLIAKVHPTTRKPMTEEMQLAQAGKRLKQMPVTEVLRDLTRMEGLVKGIEKKATKSGSLRDAAQQTMESMIKTKFGMSLGATAITAAYLTKLAFWAQNHNTYQATRLLNEKTAQNHGSQNSSATNARSHRASQPQSITPLAGSANALQPAFAMQAAAQANPYAQLKQPTTPQAEADRRNA